MVYLHPKTIGVRAVRKGFTIAELMIATTVLALLITFAGAIYNNFFGTVRNLKAANQVYDESRFSMDRISKEIRNGTIDYEEYYNQKTNFYGYGVNKTYGQNYCQYSRQFYSLGPDGIPGTLDDENTGVRNPDAAPPLGRLDTVTGEYVPDPIQNQLFLIDINGRNRTYIKRIVKTDGTGRIGILKLVGEDWGIDHNPNNADEGQNDGLIDTWICAEGFNCCPSANPACQPGDEDYAMSDESFVDITPAALDIVDLKFIIAPMDDPRKAYNEQDEQIQPHITIKLTVKASKTTSAQLTGKAPNIILESTLSARAYNEIITKCNLKECIPNDDPDLAQKKDCPKTEGVCAGAQQSCDNYTWPGCSKQTYEDWASANGDTYEDGSETASCTDDACRETLCTDGQDNDCNGLMDENDPVCKQYLCNNGTKDDETGESCIDIGDVGSICYFIHPLEKDAITGATKEASCTDGLDNDCDDLADQFDPDCLTQICNNGQLDTSFFPSAFTPKNYLVGLSKAGGETLAERCVDVGGICDPLHPYSANGGETGSCNSECQGKPSSDSCWRNCWNRVCGVAPNGDGLDNDCNGLADELDPACQAVICTNGVKDCDLAPKDYIPANDKCSKNSSDMSCTLGYLVPYQSPSKDDCLKGIEIQIPGKTNNEAAVDVGGICESYLEQKGGRYVDHSLLGAENASGKVDKPAPGGTTTPVENCTDNLNNDAKFGIDSADPACCSDTDTDTFLPNDAVSNPAGTCHPLENLPPSQWPLVDCNDSDAAINPNAPEVCNDEKYSAGFLIDQPIDNNCSAINGKTTSGWDHDDPACCIDTDGDHYGIPSAYIYKANPSPDVYLGCYGSPNLPDCNDTDKNINPGATESLATNTCFNEDGAGNPINDNCNTSEIEDPENLGQVPPVMITVQRANHIDWYKTKPGGIALAAQYQLFEPNCCNMAGTEICNDGGSDENCNGWEGFNDYACVYADKKKFLDNFSFAAPAVKPPWINSATANITFKGDTGDISITNGTFADEVVTSETLSPVDLSGCANGYNVSLVPMANVPASTSIAYQVSDDGGQNWSADLLAPFSMSFGAPANKQPRWRAKLTGDGVNKPTLNSLELTYTCL